MKTLERSESPFQSSLSPFSLVQARKGKHQKTQKYTDTSKYFKKFNI